MIFFRNMMPEDIPAGLSLCRHAGWNQLARDWQLFLTLNPTGCRVALDENGTVIGTVATLPYEDHFTWIGMVLVHPARRRQGIGSKLLQEALQLTVHHQTVKLDATPEGREVYLKLGFVDEYGISRLYANNPTIQASPSSAVRPFLPSDLPEILRMDYEVFGADRKSLLELHYDTTTQFSFVLQEYGQIKGFCLGRPGYNFNHIGPVVAKETEHATQLLLAALHHTKDKPVIVDVPDHHLDWMKAISSWGFTVQRSLIRMYRGSNLYPGAPQNQFAILGPEFG